LRCVSTQVGLNIKPVAVKQVWFDGA